MKTCSNPDCYAETNNRLYCSRRCSNICVPRRGLQGRCAQCDDPCSSGRKYCSSSCHQEARRNRNISTVGVTKRCNRCKLVKDISEFGVNRLTSDKLMYECKKCNRERVGAFNKTHTPKTRKPSYQKHGMVEAELAAILEAQKDSCPICEVSFVVASGTIDHDHTCCPGAYSCGECVRGVLCSGCNRGLGIFRDDPVRLQNAINYILRGR